MIKLNKETLKILNKLNKTFNHEAPVTSESFTSTNIEEEELPTIFSTLTEFEADKSTGVEHLQWNLIPAEQYKYALTKYMKDGDLFKFPENTIREWLKLIHNNVMQIDVITELAGHSHWFNFDELNDFYGTEFDDFNEAFKYLDDKGFFDWAVLPDGTDAISDYGINPIYKILDELDNDATAAEMLVAVNRCLDVMHQRGDLASAFIEGGAKTCNAISNS